MNSRRDSAKAAGSKLNPKASHPTVTIRVSGKLFQGHLPYLEHMIGSAVECRLWPVLSLAHLQELDRAALSYLVDGENRDFGIASCPPFVRQWIDHEKERAAA